MAADTSPPVCPGIHPMCSAGGSFSSSGGSSFLMWLSFGGEALWIVYEVFWILLIPRVALAISFASFLAMGSLALREACSSGLARPETWFLDVLQAQWLFANAVWMGAEVCWDSPDIPTPWNLTPMVKLDEDLFAKLNIACVIAFLAGPATWLLTLIGLLVRHRSSSWATAWQLFYRCAYVSCWACMDFVA